MLGVSLGDQQPKKVALKAQALSLCMPIGTKVGTNGMKAAVVRVHLSDLTTVAAAAV